MKEDIKNKIGAIKSQAQRDSSSGKFIATKRDVTNSLSKSIRNKKEAESFRIAYKSAKHIAKSR